MTYTPPSHQLTAGEYTLSNPLSGGELLLVGITGGIFYALADMAGRYMATAPVATGAAMNSVPSGQTVPNDVAVSAFPSWKTMAAQVAVAAVPGIASAFIDNPWGRAAAQGAMLGAGFNFLGGIFKGVMAMMLNQNALGQQLYLPEIEAQNAVTAAGGSTTAASAGTTTTAPAATGTGTGRLPHGVGKRFVGRDPGPMARGLGQQQTPVAMPLVPPPGITTNTGEQLQSSSPGTPIPGGPSTGPMCAPCSSTDGGIASTYDTALAATREDGCLGRFPGDMFPDDYHAAAA